MTQLPRDLREWLGKGIIEHGGIDAYDALKKGYQAGIKEGLTQALGCVPEEVEEDEAMFKDDSEDKKLGDGYWIGHSDCRSQTIENLQAKINENK